MRNRYVITGLGQVSSMGNTIDEMEQGFNNCTQNFSLNDDKSYLVAKVNGFDFYQHGFKIKTYTDRASQLCTYAVNQAAVNLGENFIEHHRKGLITASYFGCLDSASKYLYQLKTLKKAKFASPLFFTHSICNIPNSIAATECKLKGASNHLAGSNESGLMSLWAAIQSIEANQCDYVIAGGFDTLSEELLKQLSRFGLIGSCTDVDYLRGPFDKDRRYAVWGEGAAFMGIEQRESALKSGRKILGEIKGIGMATSCMDKAEAIKAAMKAAVAGSNLKPDDVAFIVSNANGTITADKTEAKAIKDVFGCKVPVYAPKSYFGETCAASGVLGIASVLSLKGCGLPQNRFTFDTDNKIDINVKYNNTTINNSDVFIVNGYNRMGTSISICIEVGERE